ncbi:ATP-binding protein [Maribacter sp. 2307ULW6-5]|uniref:PAS domain-containing sensor histidine kinase n=1 Tax=Maribacter sp. 2307ULW6-5 TaxID=3386275 RepID=UPI0039BD3B4E
MKKYRGNTLPLLLCAISVLGGIGLSGTYWARAYEQAERERIPLLEPRAGADIYMGMVALRKTDIPQRPNIPITIEAREINKQFWPLLHSWRETQKVLNAGNVLTLSFGKLLNALSCRGGACTVMGQGLIQNSMGTLEPYHQIGQLGKLLIQRSQRPEDASASSFLHASFTVLVLGALGLFILLIAIYLLYRERKATLVSQAFMKNVLKSSPSIVSHFTPIYDGNGTLMDMVFEFTSDSYTALTGENPGSVKGKRLTQLFPSSRHNGILEKMEACLKTGETQVHEYEYNIKGESIWFTNIINKLDQGVTTTARDSTLEKKAEAHLKLLNERLEKQNLELLDGRAFLSNVFKSTPNVVMHLASVRNDEGKIVDFEFLFINEAINALTGELPEELKHKKLSDVYPIVFKDGVFENLVQCVDKKEAVSYETSYEQDGKTLWFSAHAIKLNDGVTVTTSNITKEKQRENELRKLNERLTLNNSLLAEAEVLAKVGSYLWDTETRTSTLSDNYYRILECQPQSFVASEENYLKFVHPEDREAYRQSVADTLTKREATPIVYRVITKKKTIKHLRTTGHFEIRDGKKIVVGVVQDVTEEISIEQELRSKNQDLMLSNAELESFNRVASHDLQEPMRKIQMFVSRVPVETLPEKEAIYFKKIAHAANRMQNLIKYLLTYSRITKNKNDFLPVDLNEVMTKVMEDLEERIESSGVEIVVDELPKIRAIPFQMEQLLTNLLGNAIKYRTTEEQAKVVVSCKQVNARQLPQHLEHQEKAYHRISVMDNGIGFDQENADKIFELFQRLHQKETYSGTGIGLAICKKIADNHKGHIEAEGEKGKGATFCVYLPV